jgi:hypothetical protein
MNPFLSLIVAIATVNIGLIIVEVILHFLIVLFVINPNQEKEQEQIIGMVKVSCLSRWISVIHPLAFWWLEAYQWVVAFWEA